RPRGPGGRALRHPADRRPQRAELLAPSPGGRGGQAGPAQARHVHHDPGMAAVGRVRAVRWQPERHPVRAWHPDLRDGHALHPGPQRRPGAEEADPSPGGRRSQPWHRPLGVRRVDGDGGSGGGGRRPAHRGAPQARGSAVRRAAVAQARPLRGGDEPPEEGRPRCRPRTIIEGMGLWEFLRQWPRGRMIAGVVASILVHVLVAWGVLWGLKGDLAPRWVPKKGDTIIVDLPKPDEPAAAGPPAPPPPAARPAPPQPPAPPSRPAPPAPRATPSPPREERRVASAPRPTPTPPAPKAPEPTKAPEPAPPAPEPA